MSYLCPHQCEGKTEYGYCRYTWCVNPLHSNLGTAQQGQGVQRDVITNADRIRAMSDEEMADELLDLFAAFYAVEWTRETVLAHLQQEADHD